jgi:hypothetical protein
MSQSKLKIFSQQPKVTANDISIRLEKMREAAEFKCENEDHRKARYALLRNISKYEAAFKVLQNMIKEESEKFQEFRKEKITLMKEFGAERRVHPQMGEYFDQNSIKDIESFSWRLTNLEEKFKDAIQAEEDRKKENRELGQMEIEDLPEPYRTSSENFPNAVTPKQLSTIAFMLEDTDGKKD